MFVSILLIFAITIGGFALTYVIADDEKLMWRLAAGNAVGSAVFGTLAFAAASVAGFAPAVLFASLAAAFLPLLVLRDSTVRAAVRRDWGAATARLREADVQRLLNFGYYAFFLLLFVFFFRRAIIETAQGIYTGGSQNLGDLPFHLGAVFGFADGNNFPPQNPSFAGARFSYPFIADFLAASFTRLGAGVRDAMFVQNVSWAFSLLVVLERFVARLTSDKLAGKIGPALLFFSGGLGFVTFFSDYWSQSWPLTEFLWRLPADYTIGEKFRWGNSLVVMFLTQRSILLGMPLALIVLGSLWRVFAADASISGERASRPAIRKTYVSILTAGLLAGLLPLIHLHSLAVLFVVGVFLLALQPRKWKLWLTFASGAAVIAVPEILWSMAGSASDITKFIGWNFGWNKGQNESFFWFWFVNTGLLIPITAAGAYFVSLAATRQNKTKQLESGAKEKSGERDEKSNAPRIARAEALLLFYLPFAFLFIVSNVAKLAPWEWDNIKVLVYWLIGSILFAAYALSQLWRRRAPFKAIAAICFVVLILSGTLDVWRTASGQINYKVFDRDAVAISEKLKQTTTPDALFLNAPTYNTAVVLTGRRSLMRYPGHLSSHGIDYTQRQSDVRRIYSGGPDAASLMEKYQIDYVLVSPEERAALAVNDAYFMQFPVAAESGQYRVYKVR